MLKFRKDDLRLFTITGAITFRTWHIHIRQKLNIQADLTGSVTYRTPQTPCVVGKISCLVPILENLGLGYLTLGEETPSLSGGEAQRIRLATLP